MSFLWMTSFLLIPGVDCDPFNVSKMASNELITVVRLGGATGANDDLDGGDGDGDGEGGSGGDAFCWRCRLWYVLNIVTFPVNQNKFMRSG